MDVYAMLRHLFCRIFCPCPRRPHAIVSLRFGVFSLKFHVYGDRIMFTLPDDKTASASIAYVDAKGNPATVDGIPVWRSSDEAVMTVEASADGMSAQITPVGLGTAQLRIAADADLGEGVVPLLTLSDVEVVAGQAVAGNVTLTLNP